MWRKITASLAAALLLAGCTTQSWYDAFKEQQRRECERYQQQYEVQRCLERINPLTYDQYRNQRELAQEKP